MDEPEDAERPPAARYGRKRGLLTKSRSNGLDDLPGPFDALAEENPSKRPRLTPKPPRAADNAAPRRSILKGARKDRQASSRPLPILADKSNLPRDSIRASTSTRPQHASNFLPHALIPRKKGALAVYIDPSASPSHDDNTLPSPVIDTETTGRKEKKGYVMESTPAKGTRGPALPDLDISGIARREEDESLAILTGPVLFGEAPPMEEVLEERVEEVEEPVEMDKVWMEVDPLARTTAPAELDTKGHALPRAGIDAKDEPMKAVEPVPLPLPALAPIHMPTPVLDVSTHRCRTGDEIEQEKVANAKETDALSIDSDAFALPAADGEPLLPINLAPPTLIDEGEEIEDDEDEVPAEASRTSVVRFGSPIAHHRSSSPTPSEGSTTQEEPEPGPPVEVPAESSQSFLASSSSSPAKAPAKKPKLVKPMSANALETLRARFALSAIERPTSSRPYARRIRALKVEPALPECNPSQRTETATASMKRRPGTSSSRVVLITTRLKQSKPIEAKGHVVVRATRILDVAPSVASDASIDELAIVPRR